MTIVEFRGEASEWAREHWWNGGGACVVLFVLAVFFWKRPDNDYLLYAALIIVGVHAYLSSLSFGQNREDRKHREAIAVAYRQKELQLQETIDDHPGHRHHQPVAGRNGGAPSSVSGPRLQHLIAAP